MFSFPKGGAFRKYNACSYGCFVSQNSYFRFSFSPMILNKQNTSKGIMGKKLNKNLPNALHLIEPSTICFTQIRPALHSTLCGPLW
jgi:hypothetical protein